jgi:quinol monooxygenase YgiN
MSLVYFGRHSIKQGALDEARQASKQLVEYVEANHERFLQFAISIDDASNEMTVLQVHPDEASLLLHVQLAGDKIRQAYEFLDGTTQIEIFGEPSESLVGLLTQMSMGAPVTYHRPVAGFERYAVPA